MAVSLQRVPRGTPNATYHWLHTDPERCTVLRVGPTRSYVTWPASVRTVRANGTSLTGQRPAGWVDNVRLVPDA